MGDAENTIHVAVAYALPMRQIVVQLEVASGSTAGEAVFASGLMERIRGIGSRPDLARYGKAIAWDTPLEEHDRIDILRPLLADPKEFRRRRAALQAGKRGSGNQR